MDEVIDDRRSALERHRAATEQARADVRALALIASEIGAEEVARRLGDVARRAEEEVFRVAVVGEFKRGKSTLINALLGEEILPADVLPCSATLNRVTWGLTPAVRLVFKPDAAGHRREEQIPVSALADWVTRLSPDAESRAQELEEAVIHHPLRFCRDKADIIDTPGLNDDEAMTQVTLGVLPGVDAAVFVILAQSPFSGFEAEFLSRLMTHDLGRVLFVVNRMDEIRKEADRGRIIQVVSDRIAKAIRARAHALHGEGTAEADALVARIGPPKVFGVSGVTALEARRDGDAAALERSGMRELEGALERLLADERGMVTLLMLTDAGRAAAHTLVQQAKIRRGALQMEADAFEAAWSETTRALDGLRAQLDGELVRIRNGAEQLRLTLRPRAALLAARLQMEATKVVDTTPLDADAVGEKRVATTVTRIAEEVRRRLVEVAREEVDRMQQDVARALEREVVALGDFGARMEATFADIELRFAAPDGAEVLPAGVVAGAGAVSGAVGGWLFGGALSGAVSGYNVAGIRGAAAGAATGAAVGFGAVSLGGFVIAALGLPFTWPVVLPTLAAAGLAASVGARWVTQAIFGGEAVHRFRAALRTEVLARLEADAPGRIAELEQSTDRYIGERFDALREEVERQLGGAITTTQRTLDDLRARRAAATDEDEARRLDTLVQKIGPIDARLDTLATAARAVPQEGGACA